MEFTFDQIQPLIVSVEDDERNVIVEFALPGSDQVYEAKAPIRKERTVMSDVKRSVGRSLSSSLRRTASGLLRSVFGGGFAGRTARTAFNSATRGVGRNIGTGPSSGDKERAIVEAFNRVAGHFTYNEANGTWGTPSAAPAPKEPSEFVSRLSANPVTNPFDKKVLGITLAHLAYADGSISPEEIEFFNSSIPEDVGTLQSLNALDPVSGVEFEGINQGVRETIYMVAWAITLMDLDMADEEKAMMDDIAEKMGFGQSQADSLARIAKSHVLEGYLEEDMPRAELFELADKIGLSHDDAERAKVAWMKRQ